MQASTNPGNLPIRTIHDTERPRLDMFRINSPQRGRNRRGSRLAATRQVALAETCFASLAVVHHLPKLQDSLRLIILPLDKRDSRDNKTFAFQLYRSRFRVRLLEVQHELDAKGSLG